VPVSYAPDKTTDYDLGLKGDFVNHRLSVDASVYYIDWKNIQVGVLTPDYMFYYVGNAGAAKSQGVELSVEGRPLQSLKLAAWVDWDEAVLTAGFPALAGLPGAGTPLPYAARFSGHFAADEQFPLPSGATGYVGGQVSYVGDRRNFSLDLPPYAKTDVHAGIQDGLWTINLYANNVTNRLGVNQGGATYYGGLTLFIPPRTVGVNVIRSF